MTQHYLPGYGKTAFWYQREHGCMNGKCTWRGNISGVKLPGQQRKGVTNGVKRLNNVTKCVLSILCRITCWMYHANPFSTVTEIDQCGGNRFWKNAQEEIKPTRHCCRRQRSFNFLYPRCMSVGLNCLNLADDYRLPLGHSYQTNRGNESSHVCRAGWR